MMAVVGDKGYGRICSGMSFARASFDDECNVCEKRSPKVATIGYNEKVVDEWFVISKKPRKLVICEGCLLDRGFVPCADRIWK
jgi:hypothetical protein